MKDSVEFKRLIKKIIDSYESKVKMVTSLMRQVYQKIKKYQNDQDSMINKLRGILAKDEFLRKKISRMLKDFHRDQEEINTALRMLLEKGSSVRIKDFKAMLKAFRIERKNGRLKINEILNEFEKAKDEIDDQWNMVIANVK